MPNGAPAVVSWQKVYCGVLAAVYLLLTLGGLALAVFHRQAADAQTSAGEALFLGVVLALTCAACAAAFGAGLFLPRRRWAWIYHLVLIGIGMTSCACLPFTIPLLIFWIRPEVQRYYSGAL